MAHIITTFGHMLKFRKVQEDLLRAHWFLHSDLLLWHIFWLKVLESRILTVELIVDAWTDIGCWSKVLHGTTSALLSDLMVKVTD